jgi:flagella basal body P-ring formation protein FlgA
LIRLTALARAALARTAVTALAVTALALSFGAGPAAAERDNTAAFGQPVALNTDITVDGDTVTLNHLFSGLGDRGATPIARAPAPGEEVRLPADWLSRVARAYQIDWRPASNLQQASLRRAAQRIGGERIVAAIRAELTARGVDGELEVQLDNRDIALILPVDAPAKVTVAGFSYDRNSGRFTANVMAPDAQRPLARATVSGKALSMIEVPVLNRRVGRDEVIGQRDIAWVSRPADAVTANHIRDARKLVGMSARRSIRPDRPVRETDITAPVLVPRNSLVTLMLQTDRMRLTAQGRALQDGAQGEVIRVVNTKSNTTVSGVVVADGTVTVEAGSRP